MILGNGYYLLRALLTLEKDYYNIQTEQSLRGNCYTRRQQSHILMESKLEQHQQF